MYITIAGALVIGLLIWVIGSYAVVWSIEEPAYTVLEQRDGYEIRMYNGYIRAETTVNGNYREATSKGFGIIADYIFGNNTTQESISMTTPVLESPAEKTSETIAMTTPVLLQGEGDAPRTIAFIVPSQYTRETLPKPNNDAVKIVEVPPRKVAALSFTWYPTASRVEAKKEQLRALLARDQIRSTGPVETARYNPPLSMPLMLRNEILIPIE